MFAQSSPIPSIDSKLLMVDRTRVDLISRPVKLLEMPLPLSNTNVSPPTMRPLAVFRGLLYLVIHRVITAISVTQLEIRLQYS